MEILGSCMSLWAHQDCDHRLLTSSDGVEKDHHVYLSVVHTEEHWLEKMRPETLQLG